MNTIVLSLGGSVLVQDAINIDFIRAFKALVLRRKERFIIVVGGGKVCRMYQDAGRVLDASQDDIDWTGIAVTRANAELLRAAFGEHAHDEVIINPTKLMKTDKKVFIAAGWKPGCSTDHDAVLLAQTYGATTVVNMTNVDYLYDKDPRETGAKKIEKTTWKELQKIVGTAWTPGMHAPFDPVATALGGKLGLRLLLLGNDLKNFGHALDGRKFKGTVVE